MVLLYTLLGPCVSKTHIFFHSNLHPKGLPKARLKHQAFTAKEINTVLIMMSRYIVTDICNRANHKNMQLVYYFEYNSKEKGLLENI